MRYILAAGFLMALTAGAEARDRGPPCVFDHPTVGVTPCGSDEPNKAPTGQRPPGEQAYFSDGTVNSNCSMVPFTATFPGGEQRRGRGVQCGR